MGIFDKFVNNEEIENLKKAVLRKFPSLGTAMSGLKFKYSRQQRTAWTDGENVCFNPDFMNKLNYDEKVAVTAHEVMHVAFNHIPRMKNRDGKLKNISVWNIATDSVINEIIRNEGLNLPEGTVDKPEAADKSAEQMYKVLMEERRERRRQMKQQASQQGQGQGQQGGEEQENQSGQGQQGGGQGSGQQGQGSNQGGGQGYDGEDEESGDEGSSQGGGKNKDKNKGKDDRNSGSQGSDEGEDDLEDENDEPNSSNGKDKSKDKDDSSQENGSSENGDEEDYEDEDDFDSDLDEEGPENHSGWEKALKKMEKKKKKSKDKNNEDDEEDENDEEDEDEDEEGEEVEDKFRKELEENKFKNEQDNLNSKDPEKNDGKDGDSSEKIDYEALEREFSKMNKQMKKEMADKIRKEIKERSHSSGKGIGGVSGGGFGEIGEAKEVVSWKKLLKKEFVQEEQRWSYRRANRDNYYCARIERLDSTDQPSTEVILDTSGSINDELLRSFLRQVKTIIKHTYNKDGSSKDARLKIGCFDTSFYGFTEIKKTKDIDDYRFVGRGGTDIDLAVRSFSKDKKVNKILFTDGEDYSFPQSDYKDVNCIYVIFDNPRFKAPNGKTIHVSSAEVINGSKLITEKDNNVREANTFDDDENYL